MRMTGTPLFLLADAYTGLPSAGELQEAGVGTFTATNERATQQKGISMEVVHAGAPGSELDTEGKQLYLLMKKPS